MPVLYWVRHRLASPQRTWAVTNYFYLQEAVLEYLCIREREEALDLPATPVLDKLVPYVYNMAHNNLEAVWSRNNLRDLVNRLAVFPSAAL